MTALKKVFAALLMAQLCQAALVQDEIQFYAGQGIDISTKTVTTFCATGACRIPEDCANINTGSVDLSYYPLIKMEYCQGDTEVLVYSFISKDTLREIKDLSTLDLSHPLTLADTAHFKIGSYNDWLFEGMSINCSLWVAICPDFENPAPACLPSWSLPPNNWHIGRTHEGNYFLFRFFFKKLEASTNRWMTKMSYILQTDGTLNFKDANVAESYFRPPAGRILNCSKSGLSLTVAGSYSGRPGEKVYDIRGRLLEGTSHSLNPNALLFVVIKRTRGGL